MYTQDEVKEIIFKKVVENYNIDDIGELYSIENKIIEFSKEDDFDFLMVCKIIGRMANNGYSIENTVYAMEKYFHYMTIYNQIHIGNIILTFGFKNGPIICSLIDTIKGYYEDDPSYNNDKSHI